MMRMLRMMLLMCLALAGCAPTWIGAQRVLEATALVGLACDGAETDQYLHESRWIETNPVLGEHPSDARLWGYLAAVSVLLVGGNHALDRAFPVWGPRIATALALGVTGFEIQSMAINVNRGASVCGAEPGGPWKALPNGEPGGIVDVIR